MIVKHSDLGMVSNWHTGFNGTPDVDAFFQEFYAHTVENPADRSERIWGGMKCIFHCVPEGTDIYVESIRTVFRGTGNGSAGLKWLCELADRHSITLSLLVWPYGDNQTRLNIQQLIAWYRRYGFIGTGKHMARLPRNSK